MQNRNQDYKFSPRGIEKWHAFAAVVSGDEQKDTAIEIVQKSINLFDEHLDEINYIVLEALELKLEVSIDYLENNEFKLIKGYISKVDTLNSTLFINDIIIPLDSISSVSKV
ncbi:YolD-like family protein [Mycoplasma sp. P36-A1]|uniref:YolD-like family protein n=1 Tax=Mycoplasma sp. P36-A1 TaxID=3252900 RepID=UPI003C309C69